MLAARVFFFASMERGPGVSVEQVVAGISSSVPRYLPMAVRTGEQVTTSLFIMVGNQFGKRR
jgi:hypothetical protein